MKLNQIERWVVNNPVRALIQSQVVAWMKRAAPDLRPGSVLLEAGCGRGTGAALLRRTFQPAMLHGMDLDPRMVSQANSARHGNSQHTLFYVGDLIRLPYASASLDAVFGFGVLHHMPDWQGSLLEIARVLKPGGFYFLEEFYPPLYANILTKVLLTHPRTNRFYSHDLKALLNAVGLPLRAEAEIRQWGILGLAVKK
jgi:ubiquinone/menaquinone biosynthesis C-methylase UbiE